jgi:hypothetical protein
MAGIAANARVAVKRPDLNAIDFMGRVEGRE